MSWLESWSSVLTSSAKSSDEREESDDPGESAILQLEFPSGVNENNRDSEVYRGLCCYHRDVLAGRRAEAESKEPRRFTFSRFCSARVLQLFLNSTIYFISNLQELHIVPTVTKTIAMSSSSFATDVEAYYEAKESYTEVLRRTMAQGPPKEQAKLNINPKEEGSSRQFVFAGGPQISPEYPRLDFDMLRKAQAESKESKGKAMPTRKK